MAPSVAAMCLAEPPRPPQMEPPAAFAFAVDVAQLRAELAVATAAGRAQRSALADCRAAAAQLRLGLEEHWERSEAGRAAESQRRRAVDAEDRAAAVAHAEAGALAGELAAVAGRPAAAAAALSAAASAGRCESRLRAWEAEARLQAEAYGAAAALAEERMLREAADVAASAEWRGVIGHLRSRLAQASSHVAELVTREEVVASEASRSTSEASAAAARVEGAANRLSELVLSRAEAARELEDHASTAAQRGGEVARAVCEGAERLRACATEREASGVRCAEEVRAAEVEAAGELERLRQRLSLSLQRELEEATAEFEAEEARCGEEVAEQLEACQRDLEVSLASEETHCRDEVERLQRWQLREALAWQVEQMTLQQRIRGVVAERVAEQRAAAVEKCIQDRLEGELRRLTFLHARASSELEEELHAEDERLRRDLADHEARVEKVRHQLREAEAHESVLLDGLRVELQDARLVSDELLRRSGDGAPRRGVGISGPAASPDFAALVAGEAEDLRAELGVCRSAIAQICRLAEARTAAGDVASPDALELLLATATGERSALAARLRKLEDDAAQLQGESGRLSDVHRDLRHRLQQGRAAFDDVGAEEGDGTGCGGAPLEADGDPDRGVSVSEAAQEAQELRVRLAAELDEHRQLRDEISTRAAALATSRRPTGADAAAGAGGVAQAAGLSLIGRALRSGAPALAAEGGSAGGASAGGASAGGLPRAARAASDRYTADQRQVWSRIRAAQERQLEEQAAQRQELLSAIRRLPPAQGPPQ